MPTEKRLKYLERQAAKLSNVRTKEDREIEYDKFTAHFQSLGLSEFEEIVKFNGIARDWVDNGSVYHGVIPIPGVDREIVYSLTNNKKHEVGVALRYTKSNANNTDTTPSVATTPPNVTTPPSVTTPPNVTTTPPNVTTTQPIVNTPKPKKVIIPSGPRNIRAMRQAPNMKPKAASC